MPIAYSLTLFKPRQQPGPSPPLPELPLDVPIAFQGAGRLLNYGILVAEILEIDSREAFEIIEQVEKVPDWGSEADLQAYYEEDSALIGSFLMAVNEKLAEAVDADGQPRGSFGAMLAGSGLIEMDRRGRLVFRDRHLPLVDLRSELAALAHFFKFAAEHGLWLVLK